MSRYEYLCLLKEANLNTNMDVQRVVYMYLYTIQGELSLCSRFKVSVVWQTLPCSLGLPCYCSNTVVDQWHSSHTWNNKRKFKVTWQTVYSVWALAMPLDQTQIFLYFANAQLSHLPLHALLMVSVYIVLLLRETLPNLAVSFEDVEFGISVYSHVKGCQVEMLAWNTEKLTDYRQLQQFCITGVLLVLYEVSIITFCRQETTKWKMPVHLITNSQTLLLGSFWLHWNVYSLEKVYVCEICLVLLLMIYQPSVLPLLVLILKMLFLYHYSHFLLFVIPFFSLIIFTYTAYLYSFPVHHSSQLVYLSSHSSLVCFTC